MKNYIIHLHPNPYGFNIKANTADEALKQAQKRWEDTNSEDFEVELTQSEAWQVIFPGQTTPNTK